MDKRIILKAFLIKAVIVSLCATGTITKGAIIYVDDDAIGANDGSSWENAYTFLQDALNGAKSLEVEKPIEIRVAQGVYKPNQIPGRFILFHLINGVTLSGGYAGLGGTDPNERDVELFQTVLSGDLDANDIDVNDPCDLPSEPTRLDNCSSIVIGSYTDRTAVLDGFIITGGYARIHPAAIDFPTGCAGGMYIDSGSPTINNCTFTGNFAARSGGGMHNWDGSNPILTNCKFIKNYSGSGGGGVCNYGNPTFVNCTFTNNCADRGGGMYSGNGGPMQTPSIELIDCIFEDNKAEDYGGGLTNDSGNSKLINCKFIGNYAQRNGGGVAISDANSMLIDCIFIDNSSSESGGGLAGGSLIYNCIMSGNTALGNGGAIYGWGEVVNCTIIGNRANGKGGGICAQGITTLTNSIIHSNYALIGDEICAGLRIIVGRGTVWRTLSSITVSHTNVLGGEEKVFIDTDCTLVWKPGNIDVDPLFAAPGYWADAIDSKIAADPNDPNAVWVEGDYHLKSQAGRWDANEGRWTEDDLTSPCIDSGDPNSPIQHEPFPNGGIINMGAYGGTSEASKSYGGK